VWEGLAPDDARTVATVQLPVATVRVDSISAG
jgi:hypothetical protein